ncbi:MAG: HAMP domain-containing histidine kinase [Myxococcales bacterium]|nr:HAMP domain-containing histidine kinase [Myxococcales bacterium]
MRSLPALLAGGFLAALAPLGLWLVLLSPRIERLGDDGRAAVAEAVDAVRGVRLLAESLRGQERLARQALTLQDPALLGLYDEGRARLRDRVAALRRLPLLAADVAALDRLMTTEAALYDRLARAGLDRSLAPLVADTFAALEVDVRALEASKRALIDAEVAALELRADATARTVTLTTLALVGVSAALLFAVAVTVTSRLRALGAAVDRLGSGDRDTPVLVGGPADLRHLGDRLDQLRRRLRDLEADRRRFVQHASHELKTPLASVREGTSLLRDGVTGPLTAEQAEVLEIVTRSCDLLGQRVAQLVDFAVLDEAARGPGRGADLAAVVDAAVRAQRPVLAARDVTLEAAVPATPAPVRGGEDALRSVVENLLSNAGRYAPPGSAVRLSLRAEGDAWRLDVRDDGPGIPPAERARVFEAFHRGPPPADPAAPPGTGLGLAICRAHVQAMGGTIAIVDSARGAHLRVDLPAEHV